MKKRFLAISCCGALIASVASAAPTPEQEAQSKAHELNKVHENIAQTQQSVADKIAQRDAAMRDIKSLDKAIGALARKIRETSATLANTDTEVAALRAEQAQRSASIAKQRQALSHTLSASYALSRQPEIKQLLGQNDPVEVSRMMVFQRYFTTKQQQQITALTSDLSRMQTLEDEIAQKRAHSELLGKELAEQRIDLQKQRGDRETATMKLQSAIAADQQQIATWKNDEAALQTVIKQLRDAIEKSKAPPEPAAVEQRDKGPTTAAIARFETPPFRPVSGKFSGLRGRLPWPAQGKVIGSFGNTRVDGAGTWRGVVINATEGGNVRAIAHGKVVFADWLRGFGNLIIIDHGEGFMSLYGYNQGLFRGVGDAVQSGDVVAAAGLSGGQTQSGVYFEIRRNGDPVNPANWCQH